MTDPSDPVAADARRRSFLTMLAATPAVAVLPTLAPAPADAMRATPQQRAARYRESDHVRKFYETNKR